MMWCLSIRLVRYAVVGVLTLAIYLIIGQSLNWFDVPVFAQASLSFGAAVSLNYFLQKAWVFQDSRPTVSSLPKYVVMVLVGYVINLLVLIALSPRMPLLLAQLTAVVLVVASNALLSFWWVFFRAGSGAKAAEISQTASVNENP
jgi:putative flippase GtrA